MKSVSLVMPLFQKDNLSVKGEHLSSPSSQKEKIKKKYCVRLGVKCVSVTSAFGILRQEDFCQVKDQP